MLKSACPTNAQNSVTGKCLTKALSLDGVVLAGNGLGRLSESIGLTTSCDAAGVN
jgi:hypothetical protein